MTLNTSSIARRYLSLVPALLQAVRSDTVSMAGLRLRIPGSLAIRASVLAGNARMRAIIDAVVPAGGVVVDVGANIGVIAAYAARRVGASGRVIALEPAADNLAVMRENLAANGLAQVTVIDAAAGRQHELRELYLRGDVSAVNSLFPESCYASVTGTARVQVVPLDEIVSGRVDLVKIDVEGAELDVLAGMERLLSQRGLHLVAEWHPRLQRAAGYDIEWLPLALMDAGFDVQAVGPLRVATLRRADVAPLAARLLETGHPVELLCTRTVRGQAA